MNYVSAAIIEKWGENSTLTDEIPSTKVFVGSYDTDTEEYPFVTINFPGSQFSLRTNSRACYMEDETARLALWYGNSTGDYASMQRVIQGVRDSFMSWEKQLADGSGISDTIIASVGEFRDSDDGKWSAVIDLSMKVGRNVI